MRANWEEEVNRGEGKFEGGIKKAKLTADPPTPRLPPTLDFGRDRLARQEAEMGKSKEIRKA
jgi:hypothetical protein